MGKKVSTNSFESSLKDLEAIVELLENGELELEESINRFEDGVALYRDCKKMLSTVEKKVTKLTQDLKEEDI